MQVRNNNPAQRLAPHAGGECAFPNVLAFVNVDAGVDDRPATVVLKKPQVNV